MSKIQKHINRAIQLLAFGNESEEEYVQNEVERGKNNDKHEDRNEVRQLCPNRNRKLPTSEEVQHLELDIGNLNACNENFCAVLASAHKRKNKDVQKRTRLHFRAYYELEAILFDLAEERGYARNMHEISNEQFIGLLRDSDFLARMFAIYSKIFFKNVLCGRCKVAITLDEKEKMVLGSCSHSHVLDATSWRCGKCKDITIHFSTARLLQLDATCKVPESVGGLPCYNILQCLLYVFEHELVHAILDANCFGWANLHDPSPGYSRKGVIGLLNANLGYTKNTRLKAKNAMSWQDLAEGEVDPDGGHSRLFVAVLKNLFGHRHIHEDCTLHE